jgi:peptidoglycan hydrolase-like amidase
MKYIKENNNTADVNYKLILHIKNLFLNDLEKVFTQKEIELYDINLYLTLRLEFIEKELSEGTSEVFNINKLHTDEEIKKSVEKNIYLKNFRFQKVKIRKRVGSGRIEKSKINISKYSKLSSDFKELTELNDISNGLIIKLKNMFENNTKITDYDLNFPSLSFSYEERLEINLLKSATSMLKKI